MVLRGDGFTQWSAPLPILSLLMRRRSVGGLASVDDLGDGSKSCLLSEKLLHLLEYTGKDLKLVRMGVLLREMENENLLDYLDVCLDFIDQSRKEGSVLVHCFVGVSRSAAIITAYLMRTEHLSQEGVNLFSFFLLLLSY
ncbi:PREDICTED: probable dual specificity protein phosphatase DDB_G0269404 isoform X2 [Prunus mume]|uniref:protein-tyrosine-phosphatase n=1 Tax=Prunus mume TaxID=102107 RepID=A0ABM0NLV7_PRUMU|nr:PREDICTED: probable dual specificity protein phosphatase DDB_G0269404 isoform X2 [Prunus mume]